MLGALGMVLVGEPGVPIGWVWPIFTVAAGSGFAPPGWSGVVDFPTGAGPPLPGALARGIVLAPTGEAAAEGAVGSAGAAGAAETPTVGTGRVGPSGSGPFARGIVLAPIGAGGGAGAAGIPGALGAPGALGRGAGGAGADGGGRTPAGGGGAEGRGGAGGADGRPGEATAAATPIGAVGGAATGRGAVVATGWVGPVGIAEAAPGTPPEIGAVDPRGATGPESSEGARRLMRTVSFFSGTVEVVTDGLGGIGSLMGKNNF